MAAWASGRSARYPAHPRVRSYLALTTAAVLALAGCSLSGSEAGVDAATNGGHVGQSRQPGTQRCRRRRKPFGW